MIKTCRKCNIEKDTALNVKDLKITGKDILDKLKIKQGPVIGVILNHLLSSVLEDPSLNDHKKLLELSEKLYRHRINIKKL